MKVWLILAVAVVIFAALGTIVILTGENEKSQGTTHEKPLKTSMVGHGTGSPKALGLARSGDAIGGSVLADARPTFPEVPRPALPITPSKSDLAHRKALAEPNNPQNWIDYAKALDEEGRYDLALAALKRALHLGVEFEGRKEVERLVRGYEEYLTKIQNQPRTRSPLRQTNNNYQTRKKAESTLRR